MRNYAKRLALAGVLTAVALILSYVERLIPFDFGVPGIKPGLANIAVLVALYTLGGSWAALVSLVRVVIAGLLFTGVSAMLYSLAGAVAAFAAMYALKKAKVFGFTGVSVGGALMHITGQMLVASAWLGASIWVYSPWLYLTSVVTGVFNGIAAGLVVARIKRV